ncbi:MAG: hypothetical protein HC875_15940 [Anaerolineales bacterium]|nr:hypothetical protein [Anaerolineales bacterium]
MASAKEWTVARATPLSKSRSGVSALVEIAAVSLLLLVVTSLPYLYGYFSAPADRWFSGIIFNVHDTAQYLSWMRESGDRFFIDNRLTSEANTAVFVNLHWWIPGRVAAWLGLSLDQVYQLFRILSVPVYVGSVYWLCGLFFNDPRRQRFAFWLATLASGLGWIWVIDKYLNRLPDLRWPHDVYTTPGNSLWVMLASPHLTLALALTGLVLGLAWYAHHRRQFILSLAAAGVALFLGLGHIYDLVTVWAVLGMYGALLTLRDGFRWRNLLSLGVVVVVSAPAALYFGWVSSSANPLWKQALSQYDNLGAFLPSPLHLLILVGIPFFLALGGFGQGLKVNFWRTASNRDLFLKAWFVANLIAMHIPSRFQVMLLTGFQFVLAILATDFIFERVIPWVGTLNIKTLNVERVRQWLPALILLAVLPANLYLLVWRFVDLGRYEYPYYLRRDDVAAMRWLEANASRDEVVLSAFTTGHYLPGMTGMRPFLSNAVMTIDFNHKESLVKRFFAVETIDAERCDFLTDYKINYLLYGDAEQAEGPYDPAGSNLFQRVFAGEQTEVYKVNAACHLLP